MNQEGQTMKKTFKKLTALFATAALAFGLSACNDKEQVKETKQASAIEQIKQAGKVRIGVFSDKPPFGYVDAQGKSQGFDVEIGKAITKDLLGDENKVEFVLVDAANRAEYLLSKKVDIILANFTVTAARKEVVDFANPYMKVALGVVSKNGEVITNLEQLKEFIKENKKNKKLVSFLHEISYFYTYWYRVVNPQSYVYRLELKDLNFIIESLKRKIKS